jgi:hypothetical protein
MRKSLLFVAFVSFIVIGCKLDPPDLTLKYTISNPIGSNNGSNGPLLGTWFVKASIVADSPAVTSFTAKDYYLFNSDYSVKYSSSFPDTLINAKYAYNAALKKLSFGPDPEDTYTINKLTTDSLIMSSIVTITVNSIDTILPITFKLARK